VVRETVALVLTDVEGSTRLWREAPTEMDAAMRRHFELVDEVVTRYDGWRPRDQGEGDSAFLAFGTARAAVSAATDLQLALRREPWPPPVQLRVRIGVHVGEVINRDGNLYGDVVNRTARLRSLGHGGQTLLTTAVYELVRDTLPPNAGVVDLGEHRMKDLIRAERVWQLVHPDLETTFPPLMSLDRVRHNLPVDRTSFVGRDADVAELLALLRGGHRLVTLTGFGGIGKTRVALHAAAELADRVRDGVFFVDLSAVTDPAAVPLQIATSLDIRDAGTGMAAAVQEHLRERELLLVLDNLEQVLDCAPYIHDVLNSSPRLTVLATSREPLGLAAEVDYRLQPLTMPTRADAQDARSLSAYAAVRLFLDRARAAHRGFSVDDDSAPAIAEICARLDGMPLAIELAAARVKVQTPQQLLVRLEHGLSTLSSTARDRPQRHQTLRATIAWSFDLLTAGERDLLARMSVLPDSATPEAVASICAPDADEVLDLLGALVDKSLVRWVDNRFSLLVSIREYAAELLSAELQRDLSDRHLAYFLQRSVAGAALADSPASGTWDVEKRADAHHFRAAIRHAHETGRAGDELLLIVNLSDLWLEQHLREGIELLARARECAVSAGVDDVELLAYAASIQAFLLAWAGDFRSGLPIAAEGVELAGRPEGRRVLAFAYQARAEVQSDVEQRRADLIRATDLARTERIEAVRFGGTRSDSVELGAGTGLAKLDHYVHPAEAWQNARLLLHRAQASQRLTDVAGTQLLLAQFAIDKGEYDVAESYLVACETDLIGSGVAPNQLAHVRMQLGLVRDLRGAADAPDLAALADEMERIGMLPYALDVLLRLGERHALSGDAHAAAAVWARADDIARTSGSARGDWPVWRLARLDRLAGGDVRETLERCWTGIRPHAGRWLPEALSLLVEAAAAADADGDSGTAARLVAAVRGRLGPFRLRPLVEGDAAALLTRYADSDDANGDGAELPGSVVTDHAAR
jgi:predicted ATPase/class 3 adenylate cyclase